MANPRDELLALIDRIEDAAYQRGVADARSQVLKALGEPETAPQVASQNADYVGEKPAPDTDANPPKDGKARKRAPRGMARELIRRAMHDPDMAAGAGIEPRDALAHARTDLEGMVQLASIRTELRRGERDGLYIERHGRWFPAGGGAREAGHPGQGAPASRTNDGKVGDTHAAALVPDEADRD